MSYASEWLDEFRETVRVLSRSRGGSPAVVDLASGDRLAVQKISEGPGADFLTFDVYPAADDVLAAMVQDHEGEHHTARVVVTHLSQIRHIELLHGDPRGARVGFRVPD